MMNDELRWLATRVFTDEHYGEALTSEEISKRASLEEEYKDEIGLAKLMLEHNPNFVELEYDKKVEIAAKLILDLREKRESNNSRVK